MKPQKLFVCILAVLITGPLVGKVARAVTIEIVQTIDFPGEGNATLPQKVSDQGDVVGTVIYPTGVGQGFFFRLRDSKFSDVFYEPNDTGHFTHGRGINNKRHACGEYLKEDGTFHGYLLQHPTFNEVDIRNSLQTIPLGINNVGDYVGSVVLNDGTQPAFIRLDKTVTTFAVPDAIATFAYQLNTSNQIVGYYVDAGGVAHGYMRDSLGNLTYPIDVAGATGTLLLGNNDMNWVVGRYTDVSGVTHGLFFVTPDTMITFDYPDASFTSLNGINKNGFIVGSYLDASGFFHGFQARVKFRGTGNPGPFTPVTPVQPANPWIERWRNTAPAF